MRVTKKDIAILKEKVISDKSKLRDIAKKVNLSHVAVSKSIRKLESAGLIKSHICINTQKTNWIHALLRLQLSNSEKFISKKKDCPFIVSFSRVNGEYNVLVEVCAYSESSLQRFMDKCIRKNPDVKKLYLEELKGRDPPYIFLDLSKTKADCEECARCEHNGNGCDGCTIDVFLKTIKT